MTGSQWSSVLSASSIFTFDNSSSQKKKINLAIFPPLDLCSQIKSERPPPAGHWQRHQATGSKFMMLLFIPQKMSLCKRRKPEGTWFNPIFASVIWSYIYMYLRTHTHTHTTKSLPCRQRSAGRSVHSQLCFNPVEDRMRTGPGLKHDTMSVWLWRRPQSVGGYFDSVATQPSSSFHLTASII